MNDKATTAPREAAPAMKPHVLRLLSIVIPMFNEEEVIPLLRARLESAKSLFTCPIEIILVDDGSVDRTMILLDEWAAAAPEVKVVSLSRNFGHQIAVSAALHFARGDAIAIMDADLQDPPELLPQMLVHFLEGYDVVYGQRTKREGETFFKLFTAKLFYWLMRKFVAKNLPPNTGDFRLISRRVCDNLKGLHERERFLRGLVTWCGYKQKAFFYSRQARGAGVTKYPFFKMLRFAVHAAVSFSDLPLKAVLWLGVASLAASAVMILRILYLYFFGYELVPGYASLILSVYLTAGVVLVSLGMVGLYVGRIYTEVLGRPLFLVGRTINIDTEPAVPKLG